MSDWLFDALADVCLYMNRGAPPAYLGEGGVLVLNQKCIRNQRVDPRLGRRTDAARRPIAPERLLRRWDILVNSTGVGTLGRVGQIKDLQEPTTVDSHVTIVRPDPTRVHPPYLGFLLRLREPQIEALGEGSTGQTELSRTRLGGLRLPFPPIQIQAAVADTLSALDDKIDLNRNANETLEAIARAIFRDWFLDFGPTRAQMEGREPYLAPELWSRFPPDLNEDDLPLGWAMCPLDTVIEFNPRERILRGAVAPYLDMAALPISGPSAQAPILREFVSGSKFRRGDTLLARITPCLENGKTAFLMNFEDGTVGWGSTEFIVMRTRPGIPQVVSYLIARDANFRNVSIGSMTGTSGRQRATLEAIMRYPFACPPTMETWSAFGSLCKPLFDKIAANDRESRTLAQLRDLLLPKLMSGKIRVRDAEKIVAEAV